ncbi:DUF3021 domain-containing protein [Liquorilactobacillus hordei]|uniref:DUF3021 domain-containing protein n=1 Tax=Liquorilactobacillus hordei TaxID=468911 RepID=UPI0039EB5A74
MLKKIKDLLNSFLIGVGFGSTVYLLFIAFGVEHEPTMFNIFSVLLISGLIGIFSLIFDVVEWSYLSTLFIHFLGTFSLVMLMIWINDWPVWQEFISFSLNFVGIYLIIWFIVKLKLSASVNSVNQRLRERNERHKQR